MVKGSQESRQTIGDRLPSPPVLLSRWDFPKILEALLARRYRVVGPAIRDGAIVYEEIRSEMELPRGWGDEQDGGTYRLQRRGDESLFGFAAGPQACKKFLYPSIRRLWRAERKNGGFKVTPEPVDAPRYAFLGVRPCDLAAIAVQDIVFLEGRYASAEYQARRKPALLIAVNCSHPAKTCFCASVKTGPRATRGFDLALTEILQGERHEFLVEVGTPRGQELLRKVPIRPARPEDIAAAQEISERAARAMTRSLQTEGIKDLLYKKAEDPHWGKVAKRCLSCANCTMVCPTCFCHAVEDATDLAGDHAERWRKWDSCFSLDFSFIHGGSVRPSTGARYRQWLTHKLAAWIDQFGVSGCVGCGRCIAWCPVGIDLTEEVRALQEAPQAAKSQCRRPGRLQAGPQPLSTHG